MNAVEAFRAILVGDRCIRPASVANPLSMRAAEAIGYEVAMLAGSVAALEILGAPDLALITLTELTEQVRRVARAGTIPLMVDGDHGYGNALSARRMAEELAAAGAAAVTVEDTDLPANGPAKLLPIAAAAGKVRAAVEADAPIVIIGRTNANLVADPVELIARQAAFAEAGAAAVFIQGLKTLADLDPVAAKATLPVILSAPIPDASDADLAARGVRICLQGHQPHFDAVTAHYRRLYLQRHGAEPTDADPRPLTKRLSQADAYAAWAQEYLK